MPRALWRRGPATGAGPRVPVLVSSCPRVLVPTLHRVVVVWPQLLEDSHCAHSAEGALPCLQRLSTKQLFALPSVKSADFGSVRPPRLQLPLHALPRKSEPIRLSRISVSAENTGMVRNNIV